MEMIKLHTLTIDCPIALKSAPSRIGTYSMLTCKTHTHTHTHTHSGKRYIYQINAVLYYTCTGATSCTSLLSLMNPMYDHGLE